MKYIFFRKYEMEDNTVSIESISHPTPSEIYRQWCLSNAMFVSLIIFSIIMFMCSYETFEYVLMLSILLFIIYNAIYYYTGNSFIMYNSLYSGAFTCCFVIIFIILLALVASYTILNHDDTINQHF